MHSHIEKKSREGEESTEVHESEGCRRKRNDVLQCREMGRRMRAPMCANFCVCVFLFVTMAPQAGAFAHGKEKPS